MAKLRFQDLEIWQMSIDLGDRLYDIADSLERKHLYRFADQVRGAGMSMSNNIAEGPGGPSEKEFARFLDIGRRSRSPHRPADHELPGGEGRDRQSCGRAEV